MLDTGAPHDWLESSTANAPPAPARLLHPREARSHHIFQAIKEDVFDKVLGHGKDSDLLWRSFTSTASLFSYLANALVETVSRDRPPVEAAEFVRGTGDAIKTVCPGEDEEAEWLASVVHRHWKSSVEAINRLKQNDLLDEFMLSPKGREWGRASIGFLWGMLGIAFMASQDPSRFSEVDKGFCVWIMKRGAHDSAMFVRGYELALQPREADGDLHDLQVAPVPDEIALLEEESFNDAEAMLESIGA